MLPTEAGLRKCFRNQGLAIDSPKPGLKIGLCPSPSRWGDPELWRQAELSQLRATVGSLGRRLWGAFSAPAATCHSPAAPLQLGLDLNVYSAWDSSRILFCH